MNTQKPTLVQVIAWTTLASGVVNLFWGFFALSTFLGVICAPLSIIPIVLAIFELIYAAKLFSNPPQAVQPSTNLAIFEIASVLTGNVFSMAVGILSLVFYNDAEVKNYFAVLNGTSSTEPVPAPAPASSLDPEPASASDEPAPKSKKKPAKPKKAPRKVAKK